MKHIVISRILFLGAVFLPTQAFAFTNPQSDPRFGTVYINGSDLNSLPPGIGVFSGIYLFRGQNLMAATCRYDLVMQSSDGNLVIYGNTNFSQADWWTSTQGTNSQYAELQGIDGNFVIYRLDRSYTWTSNSPGDYSRHLSMQSDGNLVSYNQDGVWRWQSYTSNRFPANIVGYCVHRSEATYVAYDYMFNGDTIGGAFATPNVEGCASACVNDRTDPCTAFTWYSPTHLCYLRHSYTSAYNENAYHAISGFIRGRSAKGEGGPPPIVY